MAPYRSRDAACCGYEYDIHKKTAGVSLAVSVAGRERFELSIELLL